jgi:hypothetical protein
VLRRSGGAELDGAKTRKGGKGTDGTNENPDGLLTASGTVNRNQFHHEDFQMPNTKSVPAPLPGGLKLEQARHYLGGLSVPTMHRLIKRGLLKPNRCLRHLIFSRAELDRYLAQ